LFYLNPVLMEKIKPPVAPQYEPYTLQGMQLLYNWHEKSGSVWNYYFKLLSKTLNMGEKTGFDFDDVASLYEHLDNLTSDKGALEEEGSRMAAASEKENTVSFYLIPILGIFLLVAVVLLVVCLFKRQRLVKRMNKSGSESCTSWNTNSLKDLEVGKSDNQQV